MGEEKKAGEKKAEKKKAGEEEEKKKAGEKKAEKKKAGEGEEKKKAGEKKAEKKKAGEEEEKKKAEKKTAGEKKKTEEAKNPEKPAAKEKPKPEGEKKSDDASKEKDCKDAKDVQPPPLPPVIVMRFYMHSNGVARVVRKCLEGFDGVEDVKTDCKTHIVVVTGEKADPLKVVRRVQKKTHRHVDLLYPISKPPAVKIREIQISEFSNNYGSGSFDWVGNDVAMSEGNEVSSSSGIAADLKNLKNEGGSIVALLIVMYLMFLFVLVLKT